MVRIRWCFHMSSMTHYITAMDHGTTASFGPYVGAKRSMLLLILVARRRAGQSLPPEIWHVIFTTYFSQGVLATVSTVGHVKIYDLDTRRVQTTWRSGRGCDTSRLVPMQTRMVMAHIGGEITVWDIDTTGCVGTFWLGDGVSTCVCSLDGKVMFTTSSVMDAVFLHKWDVDPATSEIPTLLSSAAISLDVRSVYYSGISADGTTLAIGGYNNLQLWNTDTFQMRQRYDLPDTICEIVFHGNELYVATFFQVFHVRDSLEQVLCVSDSLRHVDGSSEILASFAMSPDGLYSVIVTLYSVWVQSAGTIGAKLLLRVEYSELWHCAFSPNGAYLVVLPDSGVPFIWCVSGDVFTQLAFMT